MAATSAPAAVLVWDGNGGTAGTGGNGTWATGNPRLWRLTTTSGALQAWTNGTPNGDTAHFQGTAGTVTIASGATMYVNTLLFGTTGYTIAGGSATSRLNLSGTTPTINTSTFNETISAIIDGSNGLTKTGSGQLTLSAENLFTGNTVISAGTLRLGNSAALQNSTLEYNNQGGALSFGVLSAATLGGLSGSQNLALTNAAGTDAVALSVGNNNLSTAYSGVISNGAASGGTLTKIGAGTLTLSGANTYTGLTSISGGTLAYGASNVIGSSAVSITGNSSLNLGSFSDTVGTVTVNANSSTQNITGTGTLTSTEGFELQEAWITISLAGDVGLTKKGASNDWLYKDNTYTGVTTITGGTLYIGDGGSSGTFGTGNVVNDGILIFNRGDVNTVANEISGVGAVYKNGPGTMTLSAANTYTGETRISCGVLELGNSLAIQNSTLNYDNLGGALSFGVSSATTFGGLTGSQDLALTNAAGTGAVTLTIGNNNGNAGSSAYFNVLSDGTGAGGSLSKVGASTFTLSGMNTYTGVTTISDGTLAYGASNVLATGAVTISGATALLDLGADQSDTVGTVTVETQGGRGIDGTGTSTLTSTGGFEMKDGWIRAILAGDVGLNKITGSFNDTVWLSAQNTYTGLTNVTSGTLSYWQISDAIYTGDLAVNGATAVLDLSLNQSDTVGPRRLTAAAQSPARVRLLSPAPAVSR